MDIGIQRFLEFWRPLLGFGNWAFDFGPDFVDSSLKQKPKTHLLRQIFQKSIKHQFLVGSITVKTKYFRSVHCIGNYATFRINLDGLYEWRNLKAQGACGSSIFIMNIDWSNDNCPMSGVNSSKRHCKTSLGMNLVTLKKSCLGLSM